VEAGDAEHARVVGHELALQARPRRVGAGPRMELRPRWVAEEVRHHPEDGRQLRSRQLRRRRVPPAPTGSAVGVELAGAAWRWSKRARESEKRVQEAAIGERRMRWCTCYSGWGNAEAGDLAALYD
jgi:hypothetical protein